MNHVLARPPLTVLPLAWIVLIVPGCEPMTDAAGSDLIEPFPGSVESLDELGERALEAVSAMDTAALTALRLSEGEHNESLWPELPASDPELNVPLDFVWENIEIRNRAALVRLRPFLEGEEVRVAGADCLGETRSFESFRVHTDCWVRFSSERYGEARIQLFEDVVERGGGFKVFRYYDNRPEPARS